MVEKITFEEFLELLPNSGWTLRHKEFIVRADDEECCPWLYLQKIGFTAPPTLTDFDKREIWYAADRRPPTYDPAIRAALLKACGLVELETV